MQKKTTKKPQNSPKKVVQNKPRKRPVGRPREVFLDPGKVKRIIDALRMGCTLEQAQAHADISKQTHYNRIKDKKNFIDEFGTVRNYEEEVGKAQEYIYIAAHQAIYGAIVEKKDDRAAMEFLRRRDPRYRDKQETGTPDEFINESDLEDDA